MDPTLRELMLLTLISAFLCSLAWTYEQQLAATVFAALTGGIGAIAFRMS